MADRLTVRSHGIDDVERVWQRFVPSARLERVDPQRVSFSWNSVELPGFSVVAYELAASVHSSVRMDEQIMACRMIGDDIRVEAEGRSLDPRRPWLAADGGAEAHWSGAARVRALVFDRSDAERLARIVSGDDRLVLLVWKDDISTGGGRTSVWVHPRSNLVFTFNGGRPPTLNRAWLEALMSTANSPTGLYVVPEPAEDAAPPESFA